MRRLMLMTAFALNAATACLMISFPAEAQSQQCIRGRDCLAAAERSYNAAKQRRPNSRKQLTSEVSPCAWVRLGRCLGRDPDPTVRFMIRHDSSLVND